MTLGHALLRYLEAHDFRATRAEPLVRAARYCRNHGHNHAGYLFARAAVALPMPADVLFVEPSAYEWEALDELSITEYWTGRYEDSRKHCEELLASGRLPESERARVKQNLAFAMEKIVPEQWWLHMGERR